MQLPINHKYRITGDSKQWVLEQRMRRKRQCSASVQASADVYTDWKPVGYYVTLKDLVRSLSELQLRTSNANTLVEAMVEVNRIGTELVAALSPSFEIKQRAVR